MSDGARERVRLHATEGVRLRETFFAEHEARIVELARLLAICLATGGKIMLCGNGGSAADCQHIAAEFVNRFRLERPELPAIALTTDTSVLTAIGNDYGFAQIFRKQVRALGRKGDALVAMSTSGNSPNVLEALRAARDMNLTCIGLAGRGGGEMAELCDQVLSVPHKSTPLIQEVHITVGHLLCDLVDYFLFEAVSELQPYLVAE